MEKQEKIVNMFNDIAKTYDIANRLLSFGVDKSWRKRAVDNAFDIYNQREIGKIVDVACGTGDMTAYWLKRAEILNKNIEKIYGVDPSSGMLSVAKEKLPHIEFIESGAINLPFEDSSIDIISITYGIRNVVEREKAFEEFSRVLKSGGLVVILEFMKQDESRFTSVFTNFYTRKVLPFLGGLISGNKEAYQYLPNSIDEFLTTKMMEEELKSKSLERVYIEDFSMGISTLLIAKKS
jgi:demethylmenaquinone methyltransferase/2-methoxy-6-polyprenyl-1,4-benzoquinol methylase